MVTANQANIVKRILNTLIAKNTVISDGVEKNYRGADNYPPSVKFEQQQRYDENEAMRAVIDGLATITAG